MTNPQVIPDRNNVVNLQERRLDRTVLRTYRTRADIDDIVPNDYELLEVNIVARKAGVAGVHPGGTPTQLPPEALPWARAELKALTARSPQPRYTPPGQ